MTRPPPRGLVVRAADGKTVVRPRLPPIGVAIRCLPFHAAAMALQTLILMVGTWLEAPFSASGNLALGLALAGAAGWGAVYVLRKEVRPDWEMIVVGGRVHLETEDYVRTFDVGSEALEWLEHGAGDGEEVRTVLSDADLAFLTDLLSA